MQIIAGRKSFSLQNSCAIAIGKFDGVHMGHKKLLECVLRQKEKGLSAVIFTFDPSPAVFFGSIPAKELTTRSEKRRLFQEMGFDALIEFPMTEETAGMEAEVFLEELLVKQIRAVHICAGKDLSFGKGGRGDSKMLLKKGAGYGYEAEIIEKVMIGDRVVSSSYIREALRQGNIPLANQLLGRKYSISGTVETGRQLGRTLGFPTINITPEEEKLLPENGVYYSRVTAEGNTYPGITNIGKKPTVNREEKVNTETYLYDYSGNLYGKQACVELLDYKRPEEKFDGIGALKDQLVTDITEGLQYHKTMNN